MAGGGGCCWGGWAAEVDVDVDAVRVCIVGSSSTYVVVVVVRKGQSVSCAI